MRRECKREHGDSGTGSGELVQSKWTNGRVDTHGLAQQSLKDQKKKRRATWKNVAYRVTADSRSGDIINIEGATIIRRDEEHRLVEWEPRDLVTVLLLKRVSVQDDHLGAYDKQRNKR